MNAPAAVRLREMLQFFTNIRAMVLYSGYQRIWLVP
jgi:hypothetical protein